MAVKQLKFCLLDTTRHFIFHVLQHFTHLLLLETKKLQKYFSFLFRIEFIWGPPAYGFATSRGVTTPTLRTSALVYQWQSEWVKGTLL